MSYTTPPMTTVTTAGPLSDYSAFQEAPALLTRFRPPYSCNTAWYWDTGALRESSTVFSNDAHNTAWSTCQPYSATAATYSAGVCPEMSEFKSVTKMVWDGVANDPFYFMGACCGTDYKLSSYSTAGMTDSHQVCFGTATGSSVTATMVQENLTPTMVASKGPITIIAEPMYIVWHENDVSVHVESDANSLRAAMGMETTSSIPTETAPIPPSVSVGSDSVGHALSIGAIVGIAIAFAVFGAGIAYMLAYMFMRRRKGKKGNSGSVELEGASNREIRQAANGSRVEIDSRHSPSEAENTEVPPRVHELHTMDSPMRSRSVIKDEFTEQKTLGRFRMK